MAYATANDIEIFREDLDVNMAHLRANLSMLGPRERQFATSLCNYYNSNDELTPKQAIYACKFWQHINETIGGPSAEETGGKGRVIKNLLDMAPEDLPDVPGDAEERG